MIQEEVAPFLSRFTLSNLQAQQITHALIGFQRLCEPGWSAHERVRFARKPYFDDALLLFEILVLATGEGHEALEAWQAAARRRPAAQGARRDARRAAPAPAPPTAPPRPGLVTDFTNPGR